MPGKFPEEETTKMVVLVHQLVNAIFDRSESDIPRKLIWKYNQNGLSGASMVSRYIWYKFRNNNQLFTAEDQLINDEMSEIFQYMGRRLKKSYRQQFESSENVNLKKEFVRRLQALHSTWINTEKQP